MAVTVTDVSPMATRHTAPSVSFPPPTSGNLLYVDDAITIHETDIITNAKGDLTEAVFFSYSTVHDILGQAPIKTSSGTSDLSINSRIISGSIGRSGRHVELSEPVRVALRHINTNMSGGVCVFWDYEERVWSDAGCTVVASNETETVCLCNHLTNFAVAMRPNVVSGAQIFLDGFVERLDVIGSVLAAVIVFILLMSVLRVSEKVILLVQYLPEDSFLVRERGCR